MGETPRLMLSVSDAARSLGIGRSKLYELLSDRRVESVKIGSRRLIPITAIERFAEELAHEQRAAHRAAKRGQTAAYHRLWQEENRELVREAQRRYRERHREAINARERIRRRG